MVQHSILHVTLQQQLTVKNFNFVKSLYVVGGEQTNHFKQLKAVLKEAGYDWSDDMVHVPFGMVTQRWEKFSTRKGHVGEIGNGT